MSNKPVATASTFSILLALCGPEAGMCGREVSVLERTAAREAGGCNGTGRSPYWTNEPGGTAELSGTPSEPPPTSPEVTPHVTSNADVLAAASDEGAAAEAVGATTDRIGAHPQAESPTYRPPQEHEPAAPRGDDRARPPDDIAPIHPNRAIAAAVAVEHSRVDRLALSVIDDIAHGHPHAVITKMQDLQGAGDWMSPAVRDQLLASIQPQSEPVAARFARVLDTGQPLNTPDLSVIVDHGQLLLRRDIKSFSIVAREIPRTSPWPPGREVIYIDARILAGREPLMVNTRVGATSWAQVPGVKLVELDRDAIGELPDRFVELSTGRVAQRSPGPLPETGPDLPPLHIVLVQPCQPQPDATSAQSAGDAC